MQRLPGPRSRATGHTARRSSRRRFGGNPTPGAAGSPLHPAIAAPRCKRRPWLSAGGLRGWGRGLAWVWGIAGVGLGTPKGRMSAGGRSLGARSGGGTAGETREEGVRAAAGGTMGAPKPYLPNSSPPPSWRGRKPSLHGPASSASPCDVAPSDDTAVQ